MDCFNQTKPRSVLLIGLLFTFLFTFAVCTAAEEYRLGSGDVLEISVWGHPELKTVVQVRPDGYITFPLVGNLMAAGKTSGELTTELQTRLSEYVVDPSVTVIITQFRNIEVQVLGEVRNPGYFRLKANARLLDAISSAGGPTEDANLTQVTLTRIIGDSSSLQTLDVKKFITEGDINHNPLLTDGDVIYLSAAGNVLVLGAVGKPGSYPIQGDMDLLHILALAGGALPTSDLAHAVLTRRTGGVHQEYTIDLNALMQSHQQKWTVQADDVLYIPEKETIILFGEVKAPGNYAIDHQTSLLEVIGAAGGLTAMGDPSQIRLVRSNGSEQEIITVNINDAIAGKIGANNPLLTGGDIIFVPEIMNTVLVLGEVRQPGAYVVKEGMGILDVLALAGSVTANAAQERVTVTRQSGDKLAVQEIDISQLQRTSTGRDVEILPGDVVFVPEGAPQALVLGKVAKPGSYRITDNVRLLDLLAMAGGALESAGDQVLITRDGVTVEVDLGALSRLGIGNQTIKSGDVIYVTEGKKQILVLGEVKNPGYYPLEFGDRVLDGIAKAGDLLETAAADQVTITRQTETDTSVITVDVQALMQNRFLETNFVLQGGDVIIVPKANRYVMVLGEVADPGYYQLKPGQKLIDILALAGGMTADAASDAVQVTHIDDDNNSIVTIYDVDAVIKGISSINPVIAPGSIIFVPERNNSVLVFGEVRIPGYYPVSATTHLLDAIAKAGGFTDKAATDSVSLAHIVNGETVIETIDVNAIMETGHGNIPLVGGEVIIVPELNTDVLVLGEVNQPGMYTIQKGERVLDVIAKAGGLRQSADELITVTRGEGEFQQIFTVDYREIVESGSNETNIRVNGGDIIYVPQKNRRVLVYGEVRQPGAYYVDQYTTILDIIAQAGGPTEQAKLDQVMVASTTSSELLYVNLKEIMAQQQPNIKLVGGEVIHIPVSRQILVIGEVTRPGAFNLPEGGRILDLLALAGGLKNNAAHQEIIITRQGAEGEQVWVMDYQTVISNQSEKNLLLQGGDVVFIPELSRQVLVLGEVVSPGVYTIYEGARVLDAIAMAKGPTDRAALDAIGIYRGSDIGSASTLTLGQDRLLFQGSALDNPEIRGGDIIYVPETRKPDWNKILGFMSGVRTFQQIIEWFKPSK